MFNNMIRYQHVLTAVTYLRIMKITSATFNMVEATKKDIQQIYHNFAMVVTKTDHFVRHANEVLEERGRDVLIDRSC